MEIAYARISRNELNLDLQLDAFKKNSIDKIFIDNASGVKTSKPELDKLLQFSQRGDTVVVWRLDRLGCSTTQLIKLVEELKAKGIHLKSLSEGIDTASSSGNIIFQIFCVLAEHERNVLRERTKAGLSSARARGRVGGRQKGLSARYESIKELVKEAYIAEKNTTEEIMQAFNIKSRSTLYRILRNANVNIPGFVKGK
ncbi:recombinase family protein [Cellulophaga sp. BC115SP]|uniref:recombinase family protein n=1 Tax=Cellulophaga sp. BC115SP TaxID=2683263 RepID=UPI001412116C|nr:recombinase family protein [Cellulophaga sp. BC115SP]NBB29936.1 recombinase family protein [Cellulophaga sp. BC115SP]